MGRAVAAPLRDEQLALAGECWRADQPRSVDVVSRSNRARALPHRRYVVANRDRHDNDHPAARRDRDQTWLGDETISWSDSRCCDPARRTGSRGLGWLPCNQAAVAFDAENDLQRS